MPRKVLLLICFAALLAAESACFARRFAAGILRIQGERAFFRNQHDEAWTHYRRALALGGDREILEIDQVELLLFGLDQTWAGIKVKTAFPPLESIGTAMQLVARRIADTPYKAYVWSLAADLYFHEARLRRQRTPLDLSTLSEDPLDVLLPEDRLGLAALETASRLEPNNYIYHDILTERFLEIGLMDRAATYCRRSVAAYPVLADHSYLHLPDLAPELLEAAIKGVEDSRQRDSMLRRGAVESDAGELLRRNGQERRAIGFLKRAVELSPDLYEGHYSLGVASYQIGDYETAIRALREAVRCQPENATPHVHAGLAQVALGRLPEAIEEFRKGREKDPQDVRFFHYLGETLEKTADLRGAERQFVAAAHVNPGKVEAWEALLGFYARHRDFRGAAEACSRLRSLRSHGDLAREHCAFLEMDKP